MRRLEARRWSQRACGAPGGLCPTVHPRSAAWWTDWNSSCYCGLPRVPSPPFVLVGSAPQDVSTVPASTWISEQLPNSPGQGNAVREGAFPLREPEEEEEKWGTSKSLGGLPLGTQCFLHGVQVFPPHRCPQASQTPPSGSPGSETQEATDAEEPECKRSCGSSSPSLGFDFAWAYSPRSAAPFPERVF